MISDAGVVTLYRPYVVHGLRVRSQLELPIPEAVGGLEEPDLTVHLQPAPKPEHGERMVAWAPCEIHGVDTTVHRGDSGTWIWQRSVATCHVHPDLRVVDIYPEEGADLEAMALLAMGPVCTYILLRMGVPVLHATAVLVGGRALAFAGSQGQGKSTIASFLLARGGRLLTDDSLPLRQAHGRVLGAPGVPMMKLWPETARHALGLSAELPHLLCGYEKRRLLLTDRWELVDRAVPIDVVYLLRRCDASTCHNVQVSVLPPQEAFTEILRHVANRAYLLPAEEARLVPTLAALSSHGRVRRLTYPSGFEHADLVYRSIVNDAEVER